MTLQSILDRKVRAADGWCVGHVFDFIAKKVGHEIRITHIHVGAAAWIDRLGLGALRRKLHRNAGYELPWEAIGSVGEEVRLREGWDKARCKLHPIHEQDEE
jgi:hypothetical protein